MSTLLQRPISAAAFRNPPVISGIAEVVFLSPAATNPPHAATIRNASRCLI